MHRTEHHEALPYQDVGRFMEKLRAYKDSRLGHPNVHTTVSLAVEFVVLTGVRINEIRLAAWRKSISIAWYGMCLGSISRWATSTTRITKYRSPSLCLPCWRKWRSAASTPHPMLLYLGATGSNDGTLNRANFNQFVRLQLRWENHITIHGFRSTLRDWCRANKYPEVWWTFRLIIRSAIRL